MVAWLLGNDNHSGGSTSGNSLIKTIYCWHCNRISDVAINTSPNWLHGFSTDPFPSMALSVLHWLVWFPNPLAPGSDTQIHVSWGTRLTALTSLVPHPLAVSKSDMEPCLLTALTDALGTWWMWLRLMRMPIQSCWYLVTDVEESFNNSKNNSLKIGNNIFAIKVTG